MISLHNARREFFHFKEKVAAHLGAIMLFLFFECIHRSIIHKNLHAL